MIWTGFERVWIVADVVVVVEMGLRKFVPKGDLSTSLISHRPLLASYSTAVVAPPVWERIVGLDRGS